MIINPFIFKKLVPLFSQSHSIELDGTNEYGITSPISELEGVTNFSLSFWIKPIVLNGGVVFMGYANALAGDWIYIEHWFSNNVRIRFRDSAATEVYGYTAGSSIVVGSWNHIILTFDGNGATDADKVKIYVDGVDKALTFSGTMPSSTPLYDGTTTGSDTYKFALGRRGDINGNYTNARFDEVAIFDYTLTQTQVTNIFNGGRAVDLYNTAGVTSPVHWWGFDNAVIPTVEDKGSSGGHDLTTFNVEQSDIQTDTPLVNTKSLLLDGVDECVAVDGGLVNIDATNGISISCWVKSTGFTTWDYLCGAGTTGVDSQLNFRFSNGGTLFASINGSSQSTGLNVFNDGNWHNIVISLNYANGDVKFYRDGVESATVLTFGNTYSNARFSTVGALNSLGANSMNGQVDEFAIYKTTLTQADADNIYNSGTTNDLSALNPYLWWRMGDNGTFSTNWTLIDNGSGGNNGISVNMQEASRVSDVP